MKCPPTSRAELAQLAMMLEVTAFPKPGNVDRCHDYPDTRLEHFLASVIACRPAFDAMERGDTGIGAAIYDAVVRTNCHSGGNTHFGAFILLLPLVAGGDINCALRLIAETTVDDAVLFYQAFAETEVRVIRSDDLDVHNPESIERIRKEGMTLYDLMAYSAPRDMVCREWENGFSLTRRFADRLHEMDKGAKGISAAFIELMAEVPDTFITKKFGDAVAEETRERAAAVCRGELSITAFDEECIAAGINPGSLADIAIAGIYLALTEGWRWDS
ncbi:MAG: triphosphoribosyl-dephospho-CoA synthase [Methanocalculus sp.]|uniref:triphosphoribosyl-dephospho-CoA synthase n=1 Tax=Methanocalculus sp. TaxID=2004547 RepID=UPI00271B68B4|nr:triphosphoribosyl-dephospho-CoA synthase [Methanocalculus sp.]MDO9540449.1 triphosphoribosyl-dephospho-CoA synthase [Methanocalculus sp.]